jgi:putative radical SAM enzyme (TIGR03279 family)
MLRIEAVKEGSPAEESGLKKGDVVVSIESGPVRDIIDFLYHSQGDDVRGTARRAARDFSVRLRRNGSGLFGLKFEPLEPITCSNKCVFCFIDQLPEGLRETLYVKDEDYRLSFLHGNFITMTNLGSSAIERIARQRLSPLYVSVHATNPSVRARLLGNPGGAGVLSKLRALKENRIEVHAQIVLCPGINDGAELERTVGDLSGLFPSVRSLAIVPVGLTRFRKTLPFLKPVERGCSDHVLDSVNKWQKTFVARLGTRLVFGADEFYLLSGATIPGVREYEGFPQMENGVGLVRFLLENRVSLMRRLRAKARGKPLVIFTGKLAESMCTSALSEDGIRIAGIENRFFGKSITVSGLLTGRDILCAMRHLKPEEVAVVSRSCLNEDGVFLDGLRPARLEEQSGHKLIVEGIADAKRGRSDSGTAKRGEIHAFQ